VKEPNQAPFFVSLPKQLFFDFDLSSATFSRAPEVPGLEANEREHSIVYTFPEVSDANIDNTHSLSMDFIGSQALKNHVALEEDPLRLVLLTENLNFTYAGNYTLKLTLEDSAGATVEYEL